MPNSKKDTFVSFFCIKFYGVIAISWRIVYVEDADTMKLKLDNIIIYKDGYDYTIPLPDISTIVVDSLNSSITTRLLASISKYNICLIICDNSHIPCGVYSSFNGHFHASKMLLKQIDWDSSTKAIFWQTIVRWKISNQKQVLESFEREERAISLLQSYNDEVDVADKTNREGLSAKVYFVALFGKNFIRDKDSKDVINACLNFGYSIIRAYIGRVCVGHGLVCMLGIHHKNEYNAYNLVDDLMEPFRPFVDYVVYKNMLNIKFIKRENRLELVNILNQQVKYSNQKVLVSNAIEKYVHAFASGMECGDISDFEYPEVKSFGVMYNEV